MSATDQPDPPTEQPFRFLDLPPELRNVIYVKVIEIYPTAYLKSTDRGRLATPSCLYRANRQIRSEFSAILYLSANIVAKIINFDFGHVITFFNRMNEAELKSLPSTVSTCNVQQHHRCMIIQMRLANPDMDKLKRWLNRVACADKKGTEVEVTYSVFPAGTFNSNRRWWTNKVRDVERLLSEKSQKKEARKIVDALDDCSGSTYWWPRKFDE